MLSVKELGINAKKASRSLSTAKEKKNEALKNIADALVENADAIIEANNIDIENGKANGLPKRGRGQRKAFSAYGQYSFCGLYRTENFVG